MYDGTSRIYSMNFFSGKRNFATQSCNYVNKQIERAYSLRTSVWKSASENSGDESYLEKHRVRHYN